MNRRQKKKQIKLRNKRLVKEHPYLLPRNVWTDKVQEDYNYEYTRYEEIPNGWRKAFGKELLNELTDSLTKHNYLDKFRFTQIKEKYGQLCLYNFGAPDETLDIIHKYEFISQYICIRCGRPDSGIIDNYGWYEPICKCCYDKNSTKYGWKNVPYEERIDEEDSILPLSYRITRYSKGQKEIIEYNISETANKIRAKWRK